MHRIINILWNISAIVHGRDQIIGAWSDISIHTQNHSFVFYAITKQHALSGWPRTYSRCIIKRSARNATIWQKIKMNTILTSMMHSKCSYVWIIFRYILSLRYFFFCIVPMKHDHEVIQRPIHLTWEQRRITCWEM